MALPDTHKSIRQTLLSTDRMRSTEWLSVSSPFRNLLSPLSLTFKPSGRLTWVSHPHPHHHPQRPSLAQGWPLSSLPPQTPEGGDSLCLAPHMPSKINMVTVPFSIPGKISYFLSFFLLFLQLMKEKHPEGQEKEGLFAGSQPAPPSKASRARACLG